MVKPPCWVSLEPVDWELKHTADGSEIRRSPVEMVNVYKYPLVCRVSYMFGGAGFLPSTVPLQWDVPLQMFMVSHPMRGTLTRNQNLLTTSATGRLLNFQQPFQDSRCLKLLQKGHFRAKKNWKKTVMGKWHTRFELPDWQLQHSPKGLAFQREKKTWGYKVSEKIDYKRYDSEHHFIYYSSAMRRRISDRKKKRWIDICFFWVRFCWSPCQPGVLFDTLHFIQRLSCWPSLCNCQIGTWPQGVCGYDVVVWLGGKTEFPECFSLKKLSFFLSWEEWTRVYQWKLVGAF